MATTLNQELLLVMFSTAEPNLQIASGIETASKTIMNLMTYTIVSKKERRSKPWFDIECYSDFSELRRAVRGALQGDSDPRNLLKLRGVFPRTTGN